MNPAVVLQVITFLAQNKDAIKALILSMEDLVAVAAGPDKAAVVKQYIATAMGIEGQLETSWPAIAPLFNLFVSLVKAKQV